MARNAFRHSHGAGIATLAVAALIVVHPAPASALTMPFDPSTQFQSMSQAWFGTLQGLAGKLYIALFTLELILVGYQAALFKDNLAEFFQTFVWKFAMAFAMLGAIANAGTIFPGIVNMFARTALYTINSTSNTSGVSLSNSCGASGSQMPGAGCSVGNPLDLEGWMFALAAPYFGAADLSKGGDSSEGSATGVVAFGTGDCGLSNAFTHGHDLFEMFCIMMGMILVTAGMSVFFTYLLLTFETQIVMAIGVIFLAFQGSRFTAQFSQGYMSYAINVGTKFFVFYFVLAIMSSVFENNPATAVASLGVLAAAAVSPQGAGSIVVAAGTIPIALMAVVAAGLIAAVPNFAGSILSGSSALSASAAMGQLTQAISASAGMMKANHEAQDAKRRAYRSGNAANAEYQRQHAHAPAQGPDMTTGANGSGQPMTPKAATPAAAVPGPDPDDANAGNAPAGAGPAHDAATAMPESATPIAGTTRPAAQQSASQPSAAQQPAPYRQSAQQAPAPRQPAPQTPAPQPPREAPPSVVGVRTPAAAAPAAGNGTGADKNNGASQPAPNGTAQPAGKSTPATDVAKAPLTLDQRLDKLDNDAADAKLTQLQLQAANDAGAAKKANDEPMFGPLSHLGDFAPKGEQAGAPVQVRITNSDKPA